MANFNAAFAAIVIEYEEGINQKDGLDGGPAVHGINRDAFPDWKGWERYDAGQEIFVTDTLVKDFYYERFWKSLKLDNFHHQEIANELFDQAINFGKKTGTKHLQRTLNNVKGCGLSIDGIVGPNTLREEAEIRKNKTIELITKVMNILQGWLYMRLVERDWSNRQFLAGWLKRCTIQGDTEQDTERERYKGDITLMLLDAVGAIAQGAIENPEKFAAKTLGMKAEKGCKECQGEYLE